MLSERSQYKINMNQYNTNPTISEGSEALRECPKERHKGGEGPGGAMEEQLRVLGISLQCVEVFAGSFLLGCVSSCSTLEKNLFVQTLVPRTAKLRHASSHENI